ncbi:MAG: phosphonate C-P lyase system protein PhnH [Litorilinea sp.]
MAAHVPEDAMLYADLPHGYVPQSDVPQSDVPQSNVPHAGADEHAARATFTALMWSLSYPGTVYALPALPMNQAATHQDACLSIGRALLDLETSYYTPDAALAAQLAATTARTLPPTTADYHFYPACDSSPWAKVLADMGAAKVGDMLYPDQSATLVVGCRLGQGTRLRLQGPGIARATLLAVDGLPPEFWQLRAESIHYPLGWDLFLVDGQHIDGSRVVGLPRTTMIELV